MPKPNLSPSRTSAGRVLGDALHAVDLDLGRVTAHHGARNLVYRLLVNLNEKLYSDSFFQCDFLKPLKKRHFT